MLPINTRTSLSSSVASPSLASPRAQQVSSAADLTAAVRRTSGERPPPLVGCSITLIGDAVYVFGGRLVPTRTMVSTLYRLDLRTLAWTLLSASSPPTSPSAPSSADTASSAAEAPQARYFHSACAWGDKLVIFGGEGYEPSSPTGEAPSSPATAGEAEAPAPSLRTLDDVCIWDTTEGRWLVAETKCKEGVERPAPRYAHLGAVTSAVMEEDGVRKEKSVLLVMGGQDLRNTYLHSANVLDLETLTWVHAGTWDRHIGTYRAVCTAPAYTVVPASVAPADPARDAKLGLEEGEQLVQQSYSEQSMGEKPEPLLLFSNFNFTAVRRDLDLLASPLSSEPLAPTSLSSSMAGPSLPPGLRFPTGTIIGRHLLVFGTFLSHAVNNFSIWALDLGAAGASGVREKIERGEKLEWMRIDPGSTLARGSWNRAVAWGNTVVVLGDRERDIASDYDHRQTNFTHVAFVDCESFGIYQPPPRPLDAVAQSFGLLTLSQPFLSDFEIVCSDGKRLGCSRKVLTERWPWFAAKMEEFKQRASGVQAAQQKRDADSAAAAETAEAKGDEQESSKPAPPAAAADDLRLTPRTLSLPDPSPVVQAFLQYLYTLALTTPLQLHPPVLAALVVFAKTYGDAALRGACVHALHGVLERESAAAPLVYEAATMGSATALQIRALRTMLGNSSMRNRASQLPPAGQGVDYSASFSASPASASTPGHLAPQSAASTFSEQPRGHPVNVGTARAVSGGRGTPRPPSFHGPPASPPPPTLLPPPPAPSSPQPPQPTPSLPTSSPLPFDSPLEDPRALKRRSDAVAEPTPDVVPPVPVPSWSPFLPLDAGIRSPPSTLIHARAPSASSSAQSHQSSAEGYFDAVPDLFSDGEESDSGHTVTDSLFGSPTQTYVSLNTRATSVRSRSSSLGSHRSAKESAGPVYGGGWTTSLPTQLEVEEDEIASPTGPVPPPRSPPPASTTSSSSTGSSFVAVSPPGANEPHSSRFTSSSLVSALHHRPIPRLSLPPVFHRKARRESKGSTAAAVQEADAPSIEEHWAPSFFDTMKGGQGSTRNPLSTRKATAVTPEMLASLDVAELAKETAVGVSAPLETLALPAEDDRRFSNPRPAPRPSTADSVGPSASTISLADSSSSSTPRSSTSSTSTSTRRHSFDPSSLRKLYPRPSRPNAAAASTATLAVPSSSRSLSPSPPLAGLAGRLRRSSSGKEARSAATTASATASFASSVAPEGADVLVFDPAANETVPLAASSPALGPLGLPLAPPVPPKSPLFRSAVGGERVGQRRPSLPAQLSSAAASTTSFARPGPSNSPSPPASSLSSKTRHSSSTVKLFSALHSPPPAPSPSPSPRPPVSSPRLSSVPTLTIPKSKDARLALELSLGQRVLLAAGASESEIRLRARSVGYQVLKRHEEEVERARREGKEPPSATGALGEYTGGAQLGSKFSWD
ncbi:hypothetical protein JCM6882_006118 [Rhodosporidiobolus microsporus]